MVPWATHLPSQRCQYSTATKSTDLTLTSQFMDALINLEFILHLIQHKLGTGAGAGGCSESHDTDKYSYSSNQPKKRKGMLKTYILKDVKPQTIRTLKCLREEIFEQLGKRVD